MEAAGQDERINAFSCELEDWFHILGTDKAPKIEDWPGLPLCAEKNTERLLELLEKNNAQATFFCLGWMAEHLPHVVRRCQQAGHEIGSHGYGHLLAYEAGPKAFSEDIVRAKKILEDLTGEEVLGFRSPGFSVKDDNRWVFDVVAQAGYTYDASVFPARHGHGGLCGADPGPHRIETDGGSLVEIPTSTVQVLGQRICLFGGGYLRASPLPLIRWGVNRLHQEGQPLIVYIHPREIDPNHPRLPLKLARRFKCYVNLSSTMAKLEWLCGHYRFTTMKAIAARVKQAVEERPANVEAARERDIPVAADVEARKPNLTPEHAPSSQ
jgi:polysaccharide deacetylase family protein (PEP-CTERM system associated)